MVFAGINYFAIVLAAVASFLFGGVWYNVLAKSWMAAAKLTPEDMYRQKGEAQRPSSEIEASPVPFIIAFVAQLVMAWVLAGLIGHLGPGQVTLKGGLISALFVWGGFVMTTLATNHAFQGAKRMLTLIDGGHWLGVLLIQGAVIGLIGVA